MSGVQSIERAFALLRALATGSAGVTDLADRTELPKSTVSRLLSALEEEGAVEQVESGGEYVIGGGLVDLAGATAPDATIGAIVQPFLVELAEQTTGSAGFTIRDGDTLHWIDNVDADDELVHVSDMTGQTFALHAMPSGIAVLSAMTDADLDAYLTRRSFEAGKLLEDVEPPDPASIRKLAVDARRDGVVVSYGNLIADVNAFAVPLCDSTGVVGGLYVQGPSFRFPEPDTSDDVAGLVIAMGEQINDRLAHR
ncbi:MAG: IclR family transcriptional regulator [Actinomycetota bacterium]